MNREEIKEFVRVRLHLSLSLSEDRKLLQELLNEYSSKELRKNE